MNPADDVLHFQIPTLRLCVPLASVIQVVSLTALAPVPGAPVYLRGLLNVRGRSIPTIDLAARMGIAAQDSYSIDTPIILCVSGEQQIGLIVAEILGIGVLPARDDDAQESLSKLAYPFVSVVPTDSGAAMLLDLVRLVDMQRVDATPTLGRPIDNDRMTQDYAE